ncbi:Cytochrome P450 monooxygenase aba1 [Paramyrothecium foliicola]|nr:Cytochrome P450 monooxygenase aba1 [Paramyrothecium foliicola]
MDLSQIFNTLSYWYHNVSSFVFHISFLPLVVTVYYATSSLLAWHRLRQFPAASWSSHFSYFWSATKTYSGRQYWVYKELHHRDKRPLVRIGPNELMTDDPEIIRKINSGRSGYDRSTWYTGGRFNPYHDNMFTVLGENEHTKFKSRTSHAYTAREAPDMEVGIDQQVSTMISIMRQRYAATGKLLDLGQTTNYFTLDVITRLAFGQAFGYLSAEEDRHNFLKSLKELWPWMTITADTPWIRRVVFSKLFLKFLGPKPEDKKGFGALMAVAQRLIEKRFAEEEKGTQDMMASLVKHGLDQKECEVEGLFMIVAGTESTASAIRCALVHAMTCPRVYNAIKEEIQKAVQHGQVSEPITADEAKQLPFLQAVIYEGIRMRPPLLGMFPKVVPEAGDTFHDKFVPGGTAICTNMSSLLRSQSLFGADADVYRPERFMDLGTKERREMERNVELAFGSGQWQCVGKSIAFMELNKVVFEVSLISFHSQIIIVLRNFDIQLVSPTKPCDVVSYGIFLESSMMIALTEV